MLGVIMRVETFENVYEQTFNILKVYPNSPAAKADIKE